MCSLEVLNRILGIHWPTIQLPDSAHNTPLAISFDDLNGLQVSVLQNETPQHTFVQNEGL
jgi:hypothetical protein